MTKKETLAYILEASYQFSRYLSYKTRDERVKNEVRTLFTEHPVDYVVKRHTIQALTNSIIRQMNSIINYNGEEFPELKPVEEKQRIEDLKYKEVCNTAYENTIANINAILETNNIHLQVQDLDRNHITLGISDVSFTSVQLVRYSGNKDTFDYMKPREVSYIPFDNDEERVKLATFLRDCSEFASNDNLTELIFDTYMIYINYYEKKTNEHNKANTAIEDELYSIVYKHIRTFAKDILDFDLPETM